MTDIKKRKIAVVITARPSYSRIKTALEAINAHPKLELQLVIAASALLDRYGNAIRHIEEDGFTPAAKVYMVLEGENLATMAKTAGLGLMELSTVFDNLKPDFVVTVADRYETLATAVSAAYMNIPLVHIQGGEVTGSIDEKVRHAITKLADYHFVSSQAAAERVLRMGEHPERVFVTGCPSIDLAAKINGNGGLTFDPIEKYGGVGPIVNLQEGYIVVLQHPVTTEYELSRHQVDETLHAAHAFGMPALWFWPNVDAGSDGTSKGIRAFRELVQPRNIRFYKHMSGMDFLDLLSNCKCLIGNSSVGIRECSYLGVPVVNVGSRQAGRERGPNVIDVDYNRQAILAAIRQQSRNGKYPGSYIYGLGCAGQKITDLLVEIDKVFEKRLAY